MTAATDLDPWASPDTDAPARERQERNADLPDFFKMADLVGRHVLIVPELIETIPDGKFGPYERATAKVVIVLDGRKNELFPELPRSQHNVWIYDKEIIAELRAFLNPKDAQRFGMAALGYVTVNDRKKLILEDGTTDPDVVSKARAAWKQYQEGDTAKDQAESPPF